MAACKNKKKYISQGQICLPRSVELGLWKLFNIEGVQLRKHSLSPLEKFILICHFGLRNTELYPVRNTISLEEVLQCIIIKIIFRYKET